MSTTTKALAQQSCQVLATGCKPLEPADCETLSAALDGWQVKDGSYVETGISQMA